MTLITGRISLNNNSNNAQPFPQLPSTIITEQYQDSTIVLESVQHSLHKSKCPALFYSHSLQTVVLADTHLFNRADLLKELNLRTCTSISDAELISLAYQKWGVNCTNYLTGNFAFAIWDIQKQQLMLGRDISGQRSLFYYIDSNQVLYFASLPRFLFELPGFQKKINKEKLANFLTLLPTDNHSTFFQGIYAVPAAHILTLKVPNFSPSLKRYWSAANLVDNPLGFNSPENYYEAFETLFQDVVSDYISSQDLTVSQLSGGLDSSAVTCMAAHLLQQKKKPLIAMCHVPSSEKIGSPHPYWSYDDTPFMQAVEKTYPNITNHYVHTNTNPLFDYCHTLHPWLDAPPANPSNNLWFLDCIEKTNKWGGRSLLTGQRGNSTISWTGPSTRTPISVLQHIRHLGGKQHRFLIEKLTKYGVLKLRPWTKLSGIHDKLAQETDLFHQYYQKYHQKNQRAQADFRVYYSDHMIDTLGTAAFSNTNRFLYDVELLDPTADKRIIEFCLRTPPEIFSHNEKKRLLVKNSLRNLLPECIRERTTRGMQAADWYLNVEKQKDQLKATLHSWEKNVVSDYLDINQLLNELEQWNIEKIRSSHGKKYHLYLAKYQNKLLRSMETGLFIQHHFGMT